jgi:hypothetical protein
VKTLTDAQLIDLIGHGGAAEYKAAHPSTKADLDTWIAKLRDLTDEELFEDAEMRIYDSANMGRFRGNYEDIHCKATAVFHEARRRHRAAGHDERCAGPTIYSRAHAAVMREHGYEPFTEGTCTCTLAKKSQ